MVPWSFFIQVFYRICETTFLKKVDFIFCRQRMTTYIRQSMMNILYQSNYQSGYQPCNQRVYHDSTIKRNLQLSHVFRGF